MGKKKCIIDNEQGSAIVLAMLILAVLTILGVSSTNTSTIELQIVRNERIYQNNFYLAESGCEKEAYKVGHSNKFPWYYVADPSDTQQYLKPTSPGDYDPGDDITVPSFSPDDFEKTDHDSWPHGNLLDDTNDDKDKYDYAYLTTYLYPDTPPKGYDASRFSGYKFRMNSNNGGVDIEMGGIKVGVKVSVF